MDRRSRAGPQKTSDKNISAISRSRLREMLQLGNNPALFRKFTRKLYDMAEEHLALEHTPRRQVDGWVAIEADLLSTFPDIFDNEDRPILLELAMQLMVAYHNRRRFVSKQRIPLAEALPKKRRLVMSVSMPARAALEKKRKEAKKGQEKEVIDLTNVDKCHEKRKVEFVGPKLPQMVDSSNLPIKVASCSTSPAHLTSISSRMASPSSPRSLVESHNPLHTTSTFQAHPSNNSSFKRGDSQDAFQLTGVTLVARFLNACFPSMAHYLQHFVDFGCTNEEYLVAVSTWPTDKISYFLSQVSTYGGSQRRFSDMDILILQDHFMSYFKKVQT